MSYSEFYQFLSDERYLWLPTEMYQTTTLDSKGDELVIYQVPFDEFDTPCDICGAGMNPCTDFGDSPVDVVDCEGNLCSTYDVCSELLDEAAEDDWDPKAVTDLSWQMCPQAKSNPYYYKQSLTTSSYWEYCREYMQDGNLWEQMYGDETLYFNHDNHWYLEAEILKNI